MIGITIVSGIFLTMIIDRIMDTVDRKNKNNSELMEILENLNERLKRVEKKLEQEGKE